MACPITQGGHKVRFLDHPM